MEPRRFSIVLSSSAQNFIHHCRPLIKKKIAASLQALREDPRNSELGIPLVANLTGFYKCVVGDYRIVYEIKNDILTIYVIDIDHRSKIYTKNLQSRG